MTTTSAVKLFVQKEIAAGRKADFREDRIRNRFVRTGENGPRIDADLVRELTVGKRVPSGVQICGARIEGLLDLKDARGLSGDACNALILRDCVLVGERPHVQVGCPGIDARHAHLQRLSLVDCRVDGVELTNAVIIGELDLNGLSPLRQEDVEVPDDGVTREVEEMPRACWVKARGISVGSSVTARGAQLSLPWPPDADWPPPRRSTSDPARRGHTEYWRNVRHPSALDLQGAQLSGSLILTSDRRDDGVVRRFTSDAGVNVAGATIGGRVDAEDTIIGEAGIGDHEAVFAENVEVRGHVWLRPYYVQSVNLATATVGGSLEINIGSRIEIEDRFPAERINATGLRVAGDLTLAGPMAETDLSGSVTDGDLSLGSNELGAYRLAVPLSTDPPTLKLVGASIGRALAVAAPIGVPVFPFDLASARRDVRIADLHCYPGWRLAEVVFSDARTKVGGVLAFLYQPDAGNIVILDGRSSRIYGLTDRPSARRFARRIARGHQPLTGVPVLDHPNQVREYLSLFCSYVWGEKGAFLIDVFRASVARATEKTVASFFKDNRRLPDEQSWQAVGTMEYGAERFYATLLIELSGAVTMIADRPIGKTAIRRIRYDPPFRWVESRSRTHHVGIPRPRLDFGQIGADLPGLAWEEVMDELRRELQENHRPLIDLRSARAGSLNDGEGRTWFTAYHSPKDWSKARTLRLELSGFEYTRIDKPRAVGSLPFQQPGVLDPEELVDHRLAWLRSQFGADSPSEDDYSPQPYEQVSKVWRSAGHFGAADEIAFRRLELEKVKLRPPKGSAQWKQAFRWMKQRLLWKPFAQWAFGFGLKPWRALATVLLYWLVGVLALVVLLSGALKIDTSNVGTVVDSRGGIERVVISGTPVKTPLEAVKCGDQISKALYPLDVMVPFLDLRQESRCRLSTGTQVLGVQVLTIVNGIYAIVGWVLLSAAIVTWSGVVRRRLER